MDTNEFVRLERLRQRSCLNLLLFILLKHKINKMRQLPWFAIQSKHLSSDENQQGCVSIHVPGKWGKIEEKCSIIETKLFLRVPLKFIKLKKIPRLKIV